MEVTGNAATTLSRGQVVWANGQLNTVEGAGRYINRAPFPYYWDSMVKRNEAAQPTKVERDTPKRSV